MPKLTSLLLAVVLICLTLNFCTKNSPTAIDISGIYSDTIRIKHFSSGLIKDTVIIKQVTKVDDSTYRMCRFFCLSSQYSYSLCDSLLLHLKPNNTIDLVLLWGPDRSACVAFMNSNTNTGLSTGAGYYDPSQQYLYIYHSSIFYDQIAGPDFKVWPVPLNGNISPDSCYGSCSVERMKKQ